MHILAIFYALWFWACCSNAHHGGKRPSVAPPDALGHAALRGRAASSASSSSEGPLPSLLHHGPPSRPGHAPVMHSPLPYELSTSIPTATQTHHGPLVTPDPNYDDDYAMAGIDDVEECDYSLTFKNLEDLNASANKYDPSCLHLYALDTLITMMQTAYDNYTKVDDGYDKDFGYYVTYMKDTVNSFVNATFMFDTDPSKNQQSSTPPLGPGMKFFDCESKKMAKKSCTDFTFEEKYPTILTLRDHNGYTDALNGAGISPDWVQFGDHEMKHASHGWHGNQIHTYDFKNFPVQNSSMVVPNPKDIVSKGIGNIPALLIDMQATYLDILLGQWHNGSTADPAQAYSVPVFLLMQATENMAQAKALGEKELKEEEEEAKRKKDFILQIVSIVLMFVPIVGEELAAAAGFATLAKAIMLVGEAANGALAIYDTVKEPDTAVMNVLGMLLGVGAVAKVARNERGIGKVATSRRVMSLEQIKMFGVIFQKQDEQLQSIMKMCRLR